MVVAAAHMIEDTLNLWQTSFWELVSLKKNEYIVVNQGGGQKSLRLIFIGTLIAPRLCISAIYKLVVCKDEAFAIVLVDYGIVERI